MWKGLMDICSAMIYTELVIATIYIITKIWHTLNYTENILNNIPRFRWDMFVIDNYM